MPNTKKKLDASSIAAVNAAPVKPSQPVAKVDDAVIPVVKSMSPEDVMGKLSALENAPIDKVNVPATQAVIAKEVSVPDSITNEEIAALTKSMNDSLAALAKAHSQMLARDEIIGRLLGKVIPKLDGIEKSLGSTLNTVAEPSSAGKTPAELASLQDQVLSKSTGDNVDQLPDKDQVLQSLTRLAKTAGHDTEEGERITDAITDYEMNNSLPSDLLAKAVSELTGK